MLDRTFKFIRKYHDHPGFCVFAVIITCCLVMMPLLVFGIPRGDDLTQHLQFASTYRNSILAGNPFPGWAGTDNYGFGSVGIRFYPPVAYYLMAFTQMLTDNWYDTFWTNSFFWMFLGCFGIYLWAREWLTPFESALAAMTYALVPYHRFQLFNLIIFAEFAAAGILPFCFLTLTKLIRRGKPVDVLLFSLTLTLLILTHIPSTILGIIGLGIYGLFLLEWKHFPRTIVKLLLAGSISLLASAFRWTRLLTELDWVKHAAENYTNNFYDFKLHLFPMSLDFKRFMPPLDETIILMVIGLTPLALIIFLKNRSDWEDASDRKLALSLFLTGSVCVFLTTSASLVVWENLTVLKKVQFPWRMLTVCSIIGSFAFVFSLSKLFRYLRNSNRVRLLIVFIVVTPILVYYFFPRIPLPAFYDRSEFAAVMVGLSEKKGCECWLPEWSNPSAFENREKVTAVNRNIQISKWESESREFVIEPGTAQKIRVATYFYPYWHTTVNDVEVTAERANDGTLLIPVGEEKVDVKLNFKEPLMLQLALAVSLVTWVVFLLSLLFFYRQNQKFTNINS